MSDLLMEMQARELRFIKSLVENEGVNATTPEAMNKSALHYAAAALDPSTVALLLQAGANPNVRDRLDLTPLYDCLLSASTVLQKTESVTEQDAIYNNNVRPVLTLLFSKGADSDLGLKANCFFDGLRKEPFPSALSRHVDDLTDLFNAARQDLINEYRRAIEAKLKPNPYAALNNC